MKKLPAALKGHEFKKGSEGAKGHEHKMAGEKMHPHHAHVQKTAHALHSKDGYTHVK